MGIHPRVRSLCGNGAFHFGLYCGLAGVLVDADHLLTYYFPALFGDRPFHPTLFLIAGVVIVSVATRLGGLYIRMVLSKCGLLK